MVWIKVTPETMPPFGECVLVTAYNKWIDGKVVYGEVVYNEHEKQWYITRLEDEDILFPDDLTITHWAKYPEPSDD